MKFWKFWMLYNSVQADTDFEPGKEFGNSKIVFLTSASDTNKGLMTFENLV